MSDGNNGSANYLNAMQTLTEAELSKIEMELDDLLLPYQIDLSLLAEIDNAVLVEHIARVGKDFYARQ
jgi:hypothetical protein